MRSTSTSLPGIGVAIALALILYVVAVTGRGTTPAQTRLDLPFLVLLAAVLFFSLP
jgi:hypothetical protein